MPKQPVSIKRLSMSIQHIISIFLFCFPILAFSQPLQLDWVVEYPCYAPNSLEYDKVVTDVEQNVYLCGAAPSSVNALFGSAILTQKYDSTGTLLWESKFDGMDSDRFYDCAFDGSGGFLVGGSRGCLPGSLPCRAELVNYDMENGGEIWHTFIFDTVQEAAVLLDIDLDTEGNVYAFGQYNDDLAQHDSNRMFVAKILSATGESIWQRVFPEEWQAIKGKVLEDRIRIYGYKVLGPFEGAYFLKDIDLDGNTIASVNLPAITYFPGIHESYFTFDNDGFLIGFENKVYKFGMSGDPVVWAFDFVRGLPNMKGQAKTATSDEEGNVYATGYLRDTLTLSEYTQTIKLSPDGELLWATVDKFAEESTYERGESIAVSNNHVFVNSWIWYYDSNGNHVNNDYRPILYSNEDGAILYDTLIDVSEYDHPYNTHYSQGHFYLLGRSYPPFGTSGDYLYKLFKFSVDEPSSTVGTPKEEYPVSIFPNPTDGQLTISQVGEMRFNRVLLYDAQGRQVFSKKLEKVEQTLRLPKLTAGVYLVKLTGEDLVFTDKLVVKP